MTASRGMADHDASTRLQPPLVCCIRLFCRPLRSPAHALAPASSPGPDRTPDPLHGARLRDPGGRGTARPFNPERTMQAAPPPVTGRMAGKSGAPPSDRPRAHQGKARPGLSRERPSAAHTHGAPMEGRCYSRARGRRSRCFRIGDARAVATPGKASSCCTPHSRQNTGVKLRSSEVDHASSASTPCCAAS